MSQDLTARIEAATAAVMCKGEIASIPEFFTSDYVAHLTEKDFTGGHATLRNVVGMYRRSFPDIQVTVEILVVNEDRVAWQRTLRATHEASFKGFPCHRPTHRLARDGGESLPRWTDRGRVGDRRSCRATPARQKETQEMNIRLSNKPSHHTAYSRADASASGW